MKRLTMRISNYERLTLTILLLVFCNNSLAQIENQSSFTAFYYLRDYKIKHAELPIFESIISKTINKKSKPRNPEIITGIVIHATESNSVESPIRILRSKKKIFKREFNRNVTKSWHWLIPGGSDTLHKKNIYKCLEDNRSGYHAKRSAPNPVTIDYVSIYGKSIANSRTIGIEIVNIQDGIEPFTEWQYQVLAQLIKYYVNKYPNIKHLMSHAILDPARRTDPGVCFDWEILMKLIEE